MIYRAFILLRVHNARMVTAMNAHQRRVARRIAAKKWSPGSLVQEVCAPWRVGTVSPRTKEWVRHCREVLVSFDDFLRIAKVRNLKKL